MHPHKNDIVVGNLMPDGTITVSIYGPLEAYANGLRRKLAQAAHVKKASLPEESRFVDGVAFIAVECDLESQRLNEQQARIRIRDWCRDWVLATTGYEANIGGSQGDYVDLIEVSQLVHI